MSTDDRAACRRDKSTLASFDEFTFEHLSLDLDVDFEAYTLAGSAQWSILVTKPATEVVFDTSAGLRVHSARVNGRAVEFVSMPTHKVFGTPVAIPIPADLRDPGAALTVHLQYSTARESSALQWLPPEQTAGKLHPYSTPHRIAPTSRISSADGCLAVDSVLAMSGDPCACAPAMRGCARVQVYV